MTCDVRDQQEAAPDVSEAFSHYDAAIWYTGDDSTHPVPDGLGHPGGGDLDFRDFMNYADGKVFASGRI